MLSPHPDREFQPPARAGKQVIGGVNCEPHCPPLPHHEVCCLDSPTPKQAGQDHEDLAVHFYFDGARLWRSRLFSSARAKPNKILRKTQKPREDQGTRAWPDQEISSLGIPRSSNRSLPYILRLETLNLYLA